MLRQLVIQDVVLIDRLALEFEPGLGVLTGETGAGKSILLDALGLAMGSRADASLVRSGQGSATVSAEIELPEGHAALAMLAEHGIDHEPGEPLILRPCFRRRRKRPRGLAPRRRRPRHRGPWPA
jgi:DNA repair protein RecN (Recombination protein N)